MNNRALYQATVVDFLNADPNSIIGCLAAGHVQDLVTQQTRAWSDQIALLKHQLSRLSEGHVFFEFSIPRMGKRIDVLFFYKGLVFVIEFKVGQGRYLTSDKRQVLDYCLDLHFFHEASSKSFIFPVLIATTAEIEAWENKSFDRGIFDVINTNGSNLGEIITTLTSRYSTELHTTLYEWVSSPYKPTPSIVEAARALYSRNTVADILQSDAGAQNLSITTSAVKDIIHYSNEHHRKAICFVTGLPGAGKTLVGLNIAADKDRPLEERAVYLSGNGPLVDVLREALIRDRRSQITKENGRGTEVIRQEVFTSIQNIHHFRDYYLKELSTPNEQVVVFDEAQRAWDARKLQNSHSSFDGTVSEPDFLLGVMDRHETWCVVIALIGEGQEINDGEAGVASWMNAVREKYPHWDVYFPSHLVGVQTSSSEEHLEIIGKRQARDSLHLATSMRSFRAKNLAAFVGKIIANDHLAASLELHQILQNYPVMITRDFEVAKEWVRKKHRGNDRTGLLSSSSGKRLRAVGVFNSRETDHTKWFLEPEGDVRSSNALEEAISEFKVQGLEIDWAVVCWDADLRYNGNTFEHFNFIGKSWSRRRQASSQAYLENAYRVLLTRARQGMVIYIPEGDLSDETRLPEYYDGTYRYLLSCGVQEIID